MQSRCLTWDLLLQFPIFSRAVAFAGRAHTTNTPNNTWVVFAACVLHMPTRSKSQCMHVRAQLFMSLRTYAGMPVHAHTCALLHNMRMLPRSAHETMHEYVPSPLRSHCRLELILISFSSTRLPQSKSWSPFRRPPTAAAMAANVVPPQPRQIMYEWDLLGTYLGRRSKSQGFTSMILWYT